MERWRRSIWQRNQQHFTFTFHWTEYLHL